MDEKLLKQLCVLHGVKWIEGAGKSTLNGKEITEEDIVRIFNEELGEIAERSES